MTQFTLEIRRQFTDNIIIDTKLMLENVELQKNNIFFTARNIQRRVSLTVLQVLITVNSILRICGNVKTIENT